MRSPLSTKTAALLICLLLLSPPGAWGQSLAAIPPFDRELFELGHRIFLATGNLADALWLAEAALFSRPKDVHWRTRAAQIAEWQGEVYKAKAHWFHLATIDQQPEALDHALRLAVSTGDLQGEKILLKQQLQAGADQPTLERYIRVCQILGETQEAIESLETHREGYRDFALAELPGLYEAAGEPGKAIEALERQRRETPSAESLLQQARLQFSQGDPQGAYRTLKEGRSTLVAADPDYLEVLSDLCWMLQDIACAGEASQQLLGQERGREEDSRRLYLAARQADPDLAFATGIDGWRRFGRLDFLYMAADTSRSRQHWVDLDSQLRGLEPQQQADWESSTDYWLLRSRVDRRLDRDSSALADYRQAVQIAPGNPTLAAGYLDLLRDLDRFQELQTLASRWPQGSRSPELSQAMELAHAYLGDFRQALWLARSHNTARRGDPAWLASYAHLLEQNGRVDEAVSARLQGLEQGQNLLAQGQPGSAEQLANRRAVADLRLQAQQGDALDGTMRQLAEGDNPGQGGDLLAAWALDTGRHDAARLWLWRSLGSQAQPADGVQFQLALVENDLSGVAALLENRLWRLPYRDAVEGARRIGALPLSEELAWQRSWQNPEDQLLHSQLQELLAQHPSRLGYRMRLLDRDGVGGLENRLDAAIPLSRRFTLLTEVSQSYNDPLETGVVGTIPDQDQLLRVSLVTLFDPGKATLAAGWRSALEGFPFFEAALWYRHSRWLALGGELQYSTPAEETVALALGGMKDQAALTLAVNATARNAAQLRLTRVALRDQSRRRLGEGGTYSLDLTHQLSFGYPDYALRLFGGYYDYSLRGRPRGKTLTLLPAGVVGSSFFVPDSFAQIGAGFSFGLGSRERYSQSWKPFGRAELFWRSHTQIGFRYELGVHGPVFGYDALSLTLMQESGAFNSSGLSTSLQLGYGYFLN